MLISGDGRRIGFFPLGFEESDEIFFLRAGNNSLSEFFPVVHLRYFLAKQRGFVKRRISGVGCIKKQEHEKIGSKDREVRPEEKGRVVLFQCEIYSLSQLA